MSDLSAANVYAQALLQASGDDAPTVLGDLEAFSQAREGDPGIWNMLMAPGMSSDDRTAVVERAFAKAHPLTRNFLKVLVDRRRLELLSGVTAAFRALVKTKEQQLDVRITTAVELDPELQRRLEERLSGSTGKQVRLHTSVDPSIIGGLVIQHGDTLVDSSLRSRLEQLRLTLSRGRGTSPASTSSSNAE